MRCDELSGNGGAGPVASWDPVLEQDPRVLERLFALERREGKSFRHLRRRCCFKEVQEEVLPHMRRTLAKWMLEVCEEHGAEEVVFPLAVSYVDRFLWRVRIKKTQLQLLGAVCLLLASKLRQCRTLTVDALIFYTDYSVTTKDITTWELLVAGHLEWDLARSIASDFVDPLLARLDVDREDLLRRHAHTFLALCATEYNFTSYSASLLATSCIAVAINGIPWLHKPWKSPLELLQHVEQLTDINMKYIQMCMTDVENLISLNIAQLQQAMSNKSSTSSLMSGKLNCSLASTGNQSQPETPTDVQDVMI